MRTPIKAELKEMLRRLNLPTFAAQHAAQSALAANEGWSCDQYLRLKSARSRYIEKVHWATRAR
jgi:hypothetical protein